MSNINDHSIRPADPLPTVPSFPRGDEVFRVALENADPIVREAYMSLRFQNEQLSKALLTTNQQVQHDITWRNYVIERAEAQTARLIEQLVTCKTGKAEVKRALRLTREAANARINQLEENERRVSKSIRDFERQIRTTIAKDINEVLNQLNVLDGRYDSLKMGVRTWLLPVVHGA